MPDSSKRSNRRLTSHVALLCATISVVAGVLGSGCATDDEARRAADEQERLARAAQSGGSSRRPKRDFDPKPDMAVDQEMGVLETEEVEDALQARFEDVRTCYQRAGKAQEYAGGRVLLHFIVDGTGHAQDVWVLESSLGNFSVERCLVEVGRSIVFRAPGGHKGTTFDYPVEFRSTAGMAVQDIDGLKIDRDLSAFMPQLAACGPLASQPVNAIMYIEPSGFPGSVGLAAGAALDESAGECAVRTIHGWKMSASLPGRVLRANFSIPVTIVSETEAPRTKHAASSASVRRRHR
jgi:hypothetical protein